MDGNVTPRHLSRRDIAFLLHEWLGVASLAARDRYADHSRETFDAALAEHLQSVQPDLIVLAGFMRILTPGFVRAFAGRLVNIHPSLLPAFPGTRTHARALEADVRVHGATVHLVTEALDHGPILAQAVVPVRDDDDEARLAARVLQAEHRLYPQVVCWMLEDRVSLHEGRMLIRGIDPSQRLIVMDLDRMQGNPE